MNEVKCLIGLIFILYSGYSSLPRSSHSDVGGSRIEPSNSAGLLSSLDGVPNQNYNDVASLETVTEDQEAIAGTKLRTTGKKTGFLFREGIALLFFFSTERRFHG